MVWHEVFLETLPHGSYAFGVVKSALLLNERPLSQALHSLTLVSLARVRAQPVLAGQLNTHRLKRFFQTQKIPTWERTFWPVLIIDQQVLAVLGCNGALKTDALAAKPHVNDWLTLTLNQDERLQWPSLDGVFVDE
jgi:tRNA(Ile)-lysidine synthetase-like protein